METIKPIINEEGNIIAFKEIPKVYINLLFGIYALRDIKTDVILLTFRDIYSIYGFLEKQYNVKIERGY